MPELANQAIEGAVGRRGVDQHHADGAQEGRRALTGGRLCDRFRQQHEPDQRSSAQASAERRREPGDDTRATERHGDQRRQTHAEERRGQAKQRASRHEACDETQASPSERSQLQERCAFEEGERETRGGHREGGDRDDVAEHRACLQKIERHRDQRERRIKTGARVQQAGDQEIEADHTGEAPEGERKAPRPVGHAEQAKRERHRREGQLAHAEIGCRGDLCRVASAREVAGAERVDCDSPSQICCVRFVWVPRAASRKPGEEPG